MDLALLFLALCPYQSAYDDGLVKITETVPEFRVHHKVRGDQAKISLTPFRDDFLVAWVTKDPGPECRMRLFSSPDEWVIAPGGHPDLATNGRRLVACWSEELPGDWRTMLRLYDLHPLATVHDPIRVDFGGSEAVVVPSVGMYADGDFVIVWNNAQHGETNYFARSFDRNGVGRAGTSVIRLNDEPGLDVDVGKDGRAGLVVREIAGVRHAYAVWDQVDRGSSVATVRARRFFPYTGERGPELSLDDGTGTVSNQRPIADLDQNGGVIVAWSANRVAVQLRKFDRNDAPLTPVLDVRGNEQFTQDLAFPLFLPSGHFVLAWTRDTPNRGSDVLLSVFDLECREMLERPFVVTDDGATWDQARPSLAGHFVGPNRIELAVCWTSLFQDGDIRGVYAKVLQLDLGSATR